MRYRFLLRPGWLAAFAALLALTAAFVGLGLWQFDRAHRTHRISAADLAARATPTPLDRLLSGGGITDAKSVGRAVVISGTFDAAHQLLVPDRVLAGRTGAYVITPLKLDDGGVVVVNRGWTDQNVAPAAPSGPVTLTGWLALPESTDAAPDAAVSAVAADPEHRVAAIDIAVLVNKWPEQLDRAYVSALSPAQDGLTAVPAPPPPSGKTTWNILNLGYTVQWWVFGIVAIWWFVTYVRRIANPLEDDEESGSDLIPRSPAPESAP